ncbi:response regulator [Magnetospirillum molischianum]|uniref:Chemotaxis two-component response transcriptional regulatory protein cheY n=1 Tax=Magnetospirillum molischianum DSM 120 TaxID=1150626 RepID=H8FR14_MAGML|nr:response regulator [Magnetospirillum molischianum]CCG40802.1 Chemotaxis two-component response transcriptional regulatory protein cheY [Magnetospirillum molischianum DSM 120]
MGKCVLAVDDSKTMRDMVSFTLRGAGYTVLEAENGVAALRTIQGQKVDVIITDVNMPEMDGITLVRKLRGLPAHAGTPILILTTESEQAKKDAGRSAGATGWIVKPFSPEKLLQIVAKVCP